MRALAGLAREGRGGGSLLRAPAGRNRRRAQVEDGASRPLGPALAAFLARLGVDARELAVLPLKNTRGERVGEVSCAPEHVLYGNP